MQKKDDKVNNKTAYKKDMQREKKESEKKIEMDSPKKSKFWFMRMPEKNKKAAQLITSN